MAKDNSISQYFGANLAEILAEKIQAVYPDFNKAGFINNVAKECQGKGYTQRVELHCAELHSFLPEDYELAIKILLQILGEENPNETGMFKNYYWLLPVGKYVQTYGLEHYELSIKAIEEITKRNTGEYAIRPFIRKYSNNTLKQMKKWAMSSNFHLRRLASEGLRPKLPWALKLDTFVDSPEPVFEILTILKEDPVKFVQKSVANHLTDYLKVNPIPTKELIRTWALSENKNTEWIIKQATRKIKIEQP